MNRWKPFSFLTTIALAFSLLTGVRGRERSDILIRVAIVNGANSLKIGATGPYEIIDMSTLKVIHEDNLGQVRIADSTNQGIKLEGLGTYNAALKVRTLSPADLLKMGRRRYRGEIEIRRDGRGRLAVINEVGIEEYLYGVMKSEIPPEWPREALKAQAVAARTFALRQKYNNRIIDYDLENDTTSQVYGGYDYEDPRSNQAVDETRGEIITFQGLPIEAYYHATCGGQTENSLDILDVELPYLKGVPCPFCQDSPHYHWSVILSYSKIKMLLSQRGIKVSTISSIETSKITESGRVSELTIKYNKGRSLLLRSSHLRGMVGRRRLKSTLFKIEGDGDFAKFKGRGWGHGLGLCQWGIKGMADRGYDYKEIIKYYYSGVSIELS